MFHWLAGGASLAVLAGCGGPADASIARGRFAVSHSDAEWRRRLTGEQYYVLRQAGTERAGSSPLDREHRRGTFHCAGCDQRLFSSTTKYDSGTGWPSFWQPLPRAVGTSTDHLLGYARTEVHCSRCGGHLGHVFDDGPRPTGKRYCMNGDAMIFRAA
jgi:peptide-methionine (R)-S-oxide reductase